MEPDRLMTPRLEAWLSRTRTPLDLLALMTIWLTILPFTGSTDTKGFTSWTISRLALSAIYGLDLLVRARLSAAPHRYVLVHPVALAAVVVPPVRILFSLRLLHAMFRRGNLGYFLFVALALILNGVVLVYVFERDAPGANIVTVGDAFWWAAVTVSTVGYGDFFPVTLGGRITAVTLMGIGLVSAAVVTAQIASSFMDQASARRAALAGDEDVELGPEPPSRFDLDDPGPPPDESIHERLDRIEALLRSGLADE
jgi:voltage-gated potassium channel